MFERRLRVFLVIVLLGILAVVIRLVELQVVRADFYRDRARQSLLLRPKPLPFIRGRILDRTGEVLVRDEASWAVTVDYRMLAAEAAEGPEAMDDALHKWRQRFPAKWTPDERAEALRGALADMWSDIARLSASQATMRSVVELRDRARKIYDRVRRIRAAVAARRGFDSPVAEEGMTHPILTGLDAQGRIAAKERLSRYPWVHVEPFSARRHVGDAVPLAHVLGRMGRVDAEAVASDPNADDPFAKYRPDERLGISGVEFLAEHRLRGRRGQIRLNRRHQIVGPIIEAENGRDVVLTLQAELQRRLYRLLGETVEQLDESSGGAIVVLDVPTREVLALVSYPSYDPSRFDEQYASLRDDTERLPLRFRPVQNAYAPGSIVKPLVCVAGLMGGQITLNTRETCTGYLFENHRDRWRCWRIHGTNQRKAHGSVDVIAALRGSCNIFMYRLGSKIGVDGLTRVFDMVGIGRTTGIGLKEEWVGVNPTPSWLMEHGARSVLPAHARLFAIGQGEMLMTPLQVANLMAVYASGRFRPVTLVRGGPVTPEWTLPVPPEDWRAVRQGVYEVVNDPEGTAYHYAHFVNPQFAICGKTGSATVHARPTAYRIPYRDSAGEPRVAVVRAGAKRPAIKRFVSEIPKATFDPSSVEVASTWPTTSPPPGEQFSHAWFGGYLQPLDAGRRPDFTKEPTIAFSVLVEFGGSGGRTGGPLAKRVAAEVLDVLGDALRTSGSVAAGNQP